MRRVAKALVARRVESFASRYPRDESQRRLDGVVRDFRAKRMRYETSWREDGALHLDVVTHPAPATATFLKSLSIVFALLVAASLWAMFGPQKEGAIAYLVPISTLVAVFVFPFVVAALGSQREAEEARLFRSIRKALVEDEDRPGARK